MVEFLVVAEFLIFGILSFGEVEGCRVGACYSLNSRVFGKLLI